VEGSIPSLVIQKGSMMPVATASLRDTEPQPHHSMAPRRPSHRMVVTGGGGTTNRSFLLRGSLVLRHILLLGISID
jgi:hypothetical protein